MSVDLETKYFVRAFLRFLQKQIDDCKFSADIVESLEVAGQCLETAYDLTSLSSDSSEQGSGTTGSASTGLPADNPLNHVDLYELYRNACCTISADRKLEAENIKNEGNCLMKEEKYNEALNAYNRAISIDATNPVFYCNRAAAFSRLGDYQKAADDCKMALRYDPNYSKAYGRLGMAYAKMNKHHEAEEAYKKALSLDPDNSDYQNNLSVTQQRIQEVQSEMPNVANIPNLGPDFANQLGNMDLGAAFNNPVLMNLATQMMSDPSMQETLTHLRSQIHGMNNMDGIFEIGRQLVTQMRTQNPQMFDGLAAANNANDENNPNENNNAPQPPPSS